MKKWLLLLAILLGGAAAAIQHTLPALDAELVKVNDWHPPLSVRILDAQGNLFDEIATERRIWIPIEDVPPHVIDAVLSAEDERFDLHFGIDPIGIARALWVNTQAGTIREGGSTIPQQLVKLRITGNERSIERKIREALLAIRLDTTRSKDDLLELYLNLVFLGDGNHGIEAASWDYFGCSVRDIDAGQAAMLAGLIRSPSATAPRSHADAARSARDRVLSKMQRNGRLSSRALERLVRRPLRIAPRRNEQEVLGDAYRTVVRREVERIFGTSFPQKAGLTLITPYRAEIQRGVEAAIVTAAQAIEARQGSREPTLRLRTAEEKNAFHDAMVGIPTTDSGPRPPRAGDCFSVLVEKDRKLRIGPYRLTLEATEAARLVATPKGTRPLGRILREGMVLPVCATGATTAIWAPKPRVQGAAVVLDNRTGQVVALSGGRGVELEGFVRATQALRQPGSSFKPVVYAAALHRGRTQISTVLDGPISIRGASGVWEPQNYTGEFAGVVQLRDAFARSLNTAAVRLAQETGANAIVDMGAWLGIQSHLRPDLSLALGASEVTPLDQARLVHTLVNGGWRYEPIWIVRATDATGRTWESGEVVDSPLLPLAPRLPGGAPIRAVDGAVAAQVVSMMRRVVARGTAHEAETEAGPRIAKTGTSSDFRDAWLVGATPRNTVVVWLGCDDQAPLGEGEAGGTAALPAWVAILDILAADGGVFSTPPEAMMIPDGGGWLALPRTSATARRLGRSPARGSLPPFPGSGSDQSRRPR